MDNLKLTIDQLKNYLGTGLKVEITEYYSNSIIKSIDEFESLSEDWVTFKSSPDWYLQSEKNDTEVKLLCYRLSDLDKFIPEWGFVPIEWLEDQYYTLSLHKDAKILMKKNGHKWINHMSFLLITHLFQWHFWPFGEEYFDHGLVIDKLKHG
jgi:hypothetical protein